MCFQIVSRKAYNFLNGRKLSIKIGSPSNNTHTAYKPLVYGVTLLTQRQAISLVIRLKALGEYNRMDRTIVRKQ